MPGSRGTKAPSPAARHEEDQRRRAERGRDDTDRELAAGHDQPGEGITSDEQCGAHAQRHRQQHAVARAEQAAHQMRHRERWSRPRGPGVPARGHRFADRRRRSAGAAAGRSRGHGGIRQQVPGMAGARAMGAARYAADGAGRSHRASFPASRDRPTSLSGLAVKDPGSVARGPRRPRVPGHARARSGDGARRLYRERHARQSGPQPVAGIDAG